MCPLVVIIPLIGETVKSASILSAVADLNVDVMGADTTLCNTIPYRLSINWCYNLNVFCIFEGIVLEEMEEQNRLMTQLRSFVGNRLNTSDPDAAREVSLRVQFALFIASI
jgi:hypothetical protein